MIFGSICPVWLSGTSGAPFLIVFLFLLGCQFILGYHFSYLSSFKISLRIGYLTYRLSTKISLSASFAGTGWSFVIFLYDILVMRGDIVVNRELGVVLFLLPYIAMVILESTGVIVRLRGVGLGGVS